MKLCPFFDGHVLHMSGIPICSPRQHRSIHHDFMVTRIIRCPFPHFQTKPSPKQQTLAGLWYTYPPWNIWKSVGIIIPIYQGKINNVWNHQPAILLVLYACCKTLFLGLDLPIFVTVIIHAHGLYNTSIHMLRILQPCFMCVNVLPSLLPFLAVVKQNFTIMFAKVKPHHVFLQLYKPY